MPLPPPPPKGLETLTGKDVEQAVAGKIRRGGILPNFLRETKDVLVGLPAGIAHVGRSAINDSIALMHEAVSQGKAETDFMLDDVGKAVATDYGYRYGPLFRGNFGEFARRLEERPLSFALDALAGAGGAAKGASIASRAGGVSKALESITATTGKTALTTRVRLGATGRALARAATHVDLAPETAASVAKMAYRLLPKSEQRLVGSQIVTRISARNPLIRAVAEPFHRRFSDQPIEHFAQYVAELEGMVGTPAAPKWAPSRAVHLRQVLNRAQTEGVRTYAAPRAESKSWRLLADKMKGASFGRRLRRKNVNEKEINEIHDRLGTGLVASAAERGVQISKQEALDTLAYGEYQRLSGDLSSRRPGDIDVSLGPEEAATGPIMQPTPDLDQLLAQATANHETLATALAEDFGPKGVAGVRVKDRARAVENLGGQTANALEDVLGARVVVGSAAQAAEAVAKIRARFPIMQTRNYLRTARDDGYRAADVYAQMPDGTVAEIQVHTPLVASLVEELRPVSESLRAFRLKERVGNLSPEDAREAELTRHFSRGMWSIAEREAARDLAGHVPTAMDDAMESMRHVVWRESGKDLVERFRMTPAQQVEHAYLPLRLAGGAEYDYALQAFVGGPDALELARQFDAAGTAPPVYFPHIDTRQLPSWKEFMGSEGLVGGRKRARPGYSRQSTGYLALKNLYLKNPQEAYIRHAAEAVRYQEAGRFFDEVISRTAREIESLDDFDPSVEALIAPDEVHRTFAAHLTLDDALHRAARLDTGEDTGLQNAFLSIADGLTEEQAALEVAQWVGIGKGKLFAGPKAFVRRMEEHVRPILPQRAETAVRLSWDSGTKFWRAMVLGTPKWIANNVLSNALFLKMQGGKLRDVTRILTARIYEGVSKKQSALLERMRELGIEEAASSGGFFSEASQYLPHMGSAERNKIGQLYRLMGQSKVTKKLSAPGRAIRFLNSVVEDSFREASYITALEQRALRNDIFRSAGLFLSTKKRLERLAREGISETAGAEVLEEMNFFMNDYHAMPPFQRKVIRRFVSPFWSFYRHMGRLTLRYPIEYAERANLGRMMAQLGQELADEYGPVPSWAEGSIPLGEPSQATPMLLTRASNPFSTIVTAFDAPASLLHPIPNMLWEIQTGRIGYSGREFTHPDVIAPFGSKYRYRIRRDENSVPIGQDIVDKVLPDPVEMILRQFPQYELAKDVLAGAGRYSAPGTFGLGVIRDELGEPKFPESRLVPLVRFAGVPVLPDVDILSYRERIAREGQQALREALKREGYPTGGSTSGGGGGLPPPNF